MSRRPQRSVLLNECVAVAFPVSLVVAVYLLFVGHNAPGGGFIGGLVAAAGVLLRYVAGGPHEVRELPLPRPHVLMGSGVALAGLTAMAGWIGGGSLLTHHDLKVTLPLLGQIKTSTTLPFDIGVFLVVLGMVKMLLLTLGDPPGDLGDHKGDGGDGPDETGPSDPNDEVPV